MIILPAATGTAYIDIITRRVRDALQETLRVLTVATQKVFMANTFGDGYYVKKWLVIPSVVRELSDSSIFKTQKH